MTIFLVFCLLIFLGDTASSRDAVKAGAQKAKKVGSLADNADNRPVDNPLLKLYTTNHPHKPAAIQIKTGQNKDIKSLESDTNGDGKPDIIDIFADDGDLKERRDDRNFDGKPDRTTRYIVKPTKKQVIESDENYDGKIDRIEERRNDAEFIYVDIKVDTKFVGKFDYVTSRKINRKHLTETTSGGADCEGQKGTAQQVQQLTTAFNSVFGEVAMGPLVGDFYETTFGYKIQKACVEKFGSKRALNIVADAIRIGMRCQWNLNTPQSKAHVHKMASLMLNKKNPPKILCDDPDRKLSERVLARATLPGDDGHPRISLNLNKNELDYEWSKTIFHESMHNLGYPHVEGIEYPYACETCCFGATYGGETLSKKACQICKSTFKGTSDPNYLNAITDFYSHTYSEDRNRDVIFEYLNQRPNDPIARFALVKGQSYDLTPIGVAFAESYKKRFPKLNPEQDRLINEMTIDVQENKLTSLLPPSRSIAEAVHFYYDGDLSRAEDELKKAKALVPKNPNSKNEKYIAEELAEYIDVVGWKIYDTYESRGDTSASTRVYKAVMEKPKAEN